MPVAPILLFTYKRLSTLKKTVEALKANYLAKDSQLYIFSDAAKYDKDIDIVNDVRDFIKSIDGFNSVYIIEAKINKGLAASIIDGVTIVFKKHDRVIVLEDDLGTTLNFLSFMNASLDRYELETKVFSISGYSFNLGISNADDSDAYFLNRGWSWGWATWKNRWNSVDWRVSDYESFKNDFFARRSFAKGGSDLNRMLDFQMNGKLDSWAIRWFYYQFRVNGLTIYPIKSKVFNNGFDEFATHTNGSGRRYLPAMDTVLKTTFDLPTNIEVSKYYQRQFTFKMGFLARFISKVETQFQKLLN